MQERPFFYFLSLILLLLSFNDVFSSNKVTAFSNESHPSITKSTIDSPSFFYVVGNATDSNGTSQPILAISQDNAKTWELKKIPQMPAQAKFTSIQCTGKGKKAICIAGVDDRKVIISRDGGISWELKDFGDGHYGFSNLARCVGSGDNAYCIGGFLYRDGEFYIPISKDAGKTWQFKIPKDFPRGFGSLYLSSACSNDGYCIFAGSYYANSTYRDYQVLTFGDPDSDFWHTGSYYVEGELTTTSCTGSNLNKFCVLGGRAERAIDHLFIAYLDKNQWQTESIYTSFGNRARFLKSSCTGEKDDLVCYLTGDGISAFTSSGGNWKSFEYWHEKDVTCTGGGAEAICLTLEGDKYINVYSKFKSSLSRETHTIELVDTPDINDMKCLSSKPGSKPVCIFVGADHHHDNNKQDPLCIITRDLGNTWIRKDKKMRSQGLPLSTIFTGVAITN